MRFPGKVYLTRTSYELAARELTILRYKKDQGTFDPADYRKDKPNSFRSLAPKYLKTKETLKSYRDIERGIMQAADHFDKANIKDITGGDIEDYLFGIPNISEKTRHNKMSNLRDFWTWLVDRGDLDKFLMPSFPKIPFELGYRKVTDWETQAKIIAEIDRISKNPKVAFGVELLATHPALRPADLLKIKEETIDLEHGEILIHDPTKRNNQFKQILLIPEHVQRFAELKQTYVGFPTLEFFRHVAGVSGAKQDQPFGEKMFYKKWATACENLGIEGLVLYAGTRHERGLNN